MRQGADFTAGTSPPGIFETIAAAVTALLIQPLPLVIPLLVDLYLWLGPRLSPASLIDPVARLVAEQSGAEAEAMVDGLTAFSGWGDIVALLGLFVPSVLGIVETATPWSAPSVEIDALPGVGLAVALLVVGLWGGMLLSTMLARMVRGASPVGPGWLRAATVAAVRYLGFWALVLLAIGLAMVPTLLVGVVLTLVGLQGVLALLVVTVAFVAFACLAFVRDAIAYATVGPLRACALSFGVVRRHPWPTVGFLLVTYVAAGSVGSIVARLADSLPGVALAAFAYVLVVTTLELARMRFFADRLRRWRPELVAPPHPVP